MAQAAYRLPGPAKGAVAQVADRSFAAAVRCGAVRRFGGHDRGVAMGGGTASDVWDWKNWNLASC
jgi:hypothetical protein